MNSKAERQPAGEPQVQVTVKETRGGWLSFSRSFGGEMGRKAKERRDDIVIMALGITLGLICALFPWYIFFNQEKFGVRAVKFQGGGQQVSEPMSLSPQPQLVGKPMNLDEVPIMQLDLLATGTLPDRDDEVATPSLADQPFPADEVKYDLVHVANGRAMIADEEGLWVVQVGSRLPDQSRVAAIEQRDGKWVLVTTSDRVVELVR